MNNPELGGVRGNKKGSGDSKLLLWLWLGVERVELYIPIEIRMKF